MNPKLFWLPVFALALMTTTASKAQNVSPYGSYYGGSSSGGPYSGGALYNYSPPPPLNANRPDGDYYYDPPTSMGLSQRYCMYNHHRRIQCFYR